jgi:hypothetical protein
MWKTAEQRFQTEHDRRAPHPPIDFVPFKSRDAERRSDVLVNRQRRVIHELLIDHRHRSFPDWDAGCIFAVDEDATAGRSVETGHQSHQRCLAGERRTEQHVYASTFDGERDIGDDALPHRNHSDVLETDTHALAT